MKHMSWHQMTTLELRLAINNEQMLGIKELKV